MGMALNFHYCGSHLASVSLAYNPQGCGMETTKLSDSNSLTLVQKSCCVDDLEIFQSTDDIKIADDNKGLDIDFYDSSIKGVSNAIIFSLRHNIQQNKRPPPPKTSLYRLYSSLVFYE